MTDSVCAVVVIYNRKDLLRTCLQSLLKQTRMPDCIVVVDNASTDGTRAMLDAEFQQLQRLNLEINSGGAGGFKAGMQWSYCRKFEWIWVMDDDIEVTAECLEKMLEFQDVGDIIQPRKMMPWGPLLWQAVWDVSSGTAVTMERETAFDHGRKWVPVQYCNFEGALIRRSVIERTGFPDERYFIAGDDTVYGLLASLHAMPIYIDYIGVIKKVVERGGPRNRLAFYLQVRNRFLTYDILRANGIPVNRGAFLLNSFRNTAMFLRMALNSPKPALHVRAVIDGLRDGLHHRYGRPPWL